MKVSDLINILEYSPVIAAVQENSWEDALASPCEVLFHLKANLLTVAEQAAQAHQAGKVLFVHLDLASGIGKDKTGIEFLSRCGVDGILSTRGQLIRLAREHNMIAVQRFFLLDSQGLDSAEESLATVAPHFAELMPGVVSKAISRFSKGNIPIIAGGLLESKAEVTEALRAGASAVSTSKKSLWYI